MWVVPYHWETYIKAGATIWNPGKQVQTYDVDLEIKKIVIEGNWSEIITIKQEQVGG